MYPFLLLCLLFLLKLHHANSFISSNKDRVHLDNYKSIITNKVDVHGATAMSVYKFILKKGYDGKYSTVADFVHKHKSEEIKKATIGFETSPGLQAQVDWKEDLTMISRNGEIFKLNIFLMVLGYSRTKYVKITMNRNQDT